VLLAHVRVCGQCVPVDYEHSVLYLSYIMTAPPATSNTTPVIQDDSSDARK
jgi:hypothetical protein